MAGYNGDTVPYRNAVFANEGGSVIDLEINHPDFGWTPTSVSSSDEEELAKLFARISTAGDAGAYAPPEVVAAGIPQTISRRQFYTALMLNGTITQEEYLMVFRGFLPAALQAIVDSIPNSVERAVATGLLLGAGEFQRGHDLVHTFQTANGWHSEDVDAFFKAAYAL